MSNYSTSSDILTGGNANIQELFTALQSELPVAWQSATHSAYSYAPAGSTAFNTINSISSIPCQADELLIGFSQIAWSVNSTTAEWYVRHNISGETLEIGNRAEVVSTKNDTGGKVHTLTLISLFENLTGTKTLLLECGNSDLGPTTTFYSHLGRSFALRLKKRA